MTKGKELTVNQQAGHWLNTKKDSIMSMVPNAKVADRLMTIMIREVGSSGALAKCSQASILESAIESAKLGLEIGGSLGQCYLVPYKGQAKLIVSYKGLIALMKRGNPEIRDVFPIMIKEGDKYVVDEYTSRLSHKYDPLDEEREAKPYVGVYCRIIYQDGHTWDHIMTKAQVEKRRKVAQTQNVWKQWPDEMALKTVVRSAAKYVDLAAEVREMITEMDAREVDLQILEAKPVPSGVEATKAAIQAPEETPVDGRSPLD